MASKDQQGKKVNRIDVQEYPEILLNITFEAEDRSLSLDTGAKVTVIDEAFALKEIENAAKKIKPSNTVGTVRAGGKQ